MFNIRISALADEEINTEIIAVIVAAIEAILGHASANPGGLIIRKISRVSGEKLAWSNAGLMECIDSRRF
ncbi:MAG: hypothetical protein PHE79_07220 [Eubacteriales bacterium]|nr:hypothetical protein [Eubacteriales bacterium]